MTGQTEFIRVFLEDDSMKAVSITMPCSIGDLTDALRKKMYMVDTTSYYIFEYRGGKRAFFPSQAPTESLAHSVQRCAR